VTGYVKLWRQIQHTPIWKHSVALHVFLDLLLRVTHKPTTTFISAGADRRVQVDLLPGQYAIKQVLLADDLGRDRKTIKAALDLLVDLEYITLQQEGQYAVITIPNWGRYQDDQPGEKADRLTPACGENGQADGQADERTQLSSNKKKKARFVPEEIDMPPELGDTFRPHWAEWCRWRREEKHKPITPTAAREQLKDLASWGPSAAQASIQKSIKSDWTGLFWPSPNGHATTPTVPPLSTDLP